MSEKTQFVSGLYKGNAVDDVFRVIRPEVAQTRNGDSYLKMCLADKTGFVEAVFWNPTPENLQYTPRLQFVHVRGDVRAYQQKTQIYINSLVCVDEPDDASGFVPCSPFPLPDLLFRFNAHRASIRNRPLHSLLAAVFDDPVTWERFITFPAAKSNHHAFRHGLLQHTLEVADLTKATVLARHAACSEAVSSTPSLDLAVAGALLHDIGKTKELKADGCGFEYNVTGHLLGHISLGFHMVTAKMGRDLPSILRNNLLHILLAHHGKREYGSPVTPMTPEAIIVHTADTLSMQLWAIGQAQQAGAGDDWGNHPCLDDQPRMNSRRLYLGSNGVELEEEDITADAFYPTASFPAIVVSEERVAWSLVLPWDKPGTASESQNFAVVRVKVLGRIAAGVPLLAEEDSNEQIEIEGAFGAGMHFALRVSGDSMIGDGIEDGDLLIARQQDVPDDGDIVVAEITGGATGARDGATVKRYSADANGPILLASNPAYAPIRLQPGETLRIRGVAVGVARRSD